MLYSLCCVIPSGTRHERWIRVARRIPSLTGNALHSVRSAAVKDVVCASF
jgi:hypothetical protein